jgi:hypothetical protein
MADERQAPTPAEQVAGLYEQAESRAAKAGERLVGSQGFASVLGQMAENVAALTKLGNDGMDLVLRNLRVAGRRDVVRLARQLARTEDKLERVLQELEELRDELRRRDESPASRGSAKSASARQQAGNGATAPQRRRRSSGSGGGTRSTGKS